MTDTRKKQTRRNLVIFSIVSISIGWIGLGLNRMMANEAPGQNLGMLLWLVVPALTGLLLRAAAGDGWADAGLRPLASQKNHMAVYLTGIYADDAARRHFEAAYRATGKRFDVGKLCVRFRKLDDLPLVLIGESIASCGVTEESASGQAPIRASGRQRLAARQRRAPPS